MLEAKGRIKYNPDVKPDVSHYMLECPQLEIAVSGSGDINQMMDELTERVRRAISEEFLVAPSLVQVIGYSMGLTFAIEGPVNHSLDDFAKEAGESKEPGKTTVTISHPGRKDIIATPEQLVLAGEVMEVSKATGLPPEEVLAIAKARMKKGKAEGAE